MDRLAAMKVFVTAIDEGSLGAAARRVGRSNAAVTRAITFLENHVGAKLLHRTTRIMRLTEAGERYAPVCRRVIDELEEADASVAGEHAAPHGLLTITAPVQFGTHILRPIVSGFLEAQPAVRVRYLLLDRPVDLVDEGLDVALRIAHLPDSSLIAIRLGEVRRVVCASPSYLAGKPAVREPADLTGHMCVAVTQTAQEETWTFPPATGGTTARTVRLKPRLAVNAIEAAVHAAVDGEGFTRVLSYQIESEVRAGRLLILLQDDEPPALPVHLVVPDGRLAIAKVRHFIDFAAPRIKAHLQTLPQNNQTNF